jgi:V/A-type H+-transporting ATPase subunit A
VSPPSADFSEPVTTHTKRYVRCFWALDATRAHARFYPAIHPLVSYSEDAEALASFWTAQGNPDWPAQRRRFLTLLEQEARLERMARIVGMDALPPRQQLTLLCAELINEGFLRQSAFSETDRFCSPGRQMAMMQILMRFIGLAEAALAQGGAIERIRSLGVLRGLRRMGEEIPDEHPEAFDRLRAALETELAQLLEQASTHAG